MQVLYNVYLNLLDYARSALRLNAGFDVLFNKIDTAELGAVRFANRCRGVIDWCRSHLVLPHIADLSNHSGSHTLRTYIQRGVERIFDLCQGVGALRKTRYRGLPRVTLHAQLVATAHSLLRTANLMAVPPEQQR